MDLFAAAGIDLKDGGRAGVGRTLRVPLFNHRVVEEARRRVVVELSEQQLAAARGYAKMARSPKFAGYRETALRNRFVNDVLGTILGYSQVDPDRAYTLAFERPIRRGTVDIALGRFPGSDGKDEIVAPFELKGPDTGDLDAIMLGRGRSPVQQAWEYVIDAPGCRWVLVSNCVEIRLYGFGRGRDAYELFDLTKLDDPDEHERLWLILSADRFLGNATEALLRETDSAYKEITDVLYRDYRGLRDRLIQYLTDSAEGPKLPLAAAIEQAQKVLDRILFIAFAQRTDLLPDRLLERARDARNEFAPKPMWDNFQVLFRHLDQGRPELAITAYNGGLFAPDPIAESLVLPAELTEDLVKLGGWDYRRDVPVTVLGHIFEQSITDLEKLRAESLGLSPPKVSKRKREGVIYTPDIVTRFLVEHTIGLALSERFDALLARHGKGETKRSNGERIFSPKEEATERTFLHDYLAALRDFTIVDPACGSGAFLVAAFDLLAAEHRRVAMRLQDLKAPIDFDPVDEIVTRNLFGVDLNAESVEITRLALWLKTARRYHRLQNLEATVKVGNSLIADPKFTDRPFDWRAAFPDAFARGGFDVVIGNPPYVRMELIKPVKPYLEEHYVVAADRADLYAYFFERGVSLLKEGGRLGYISSSTFFRTGSGENLRRFLGDRVAIESVIDFGDLQLFEGVTTYPAIVTLKKGGTADEGQLSFLKVDGALPNDLSAAFEEKALSMPRARLAAGSWQFEDEPLARLREKIAVGRSTLKEIHGPPLRGIVTGLNEAFIVDRATHDRLIAADPKSSDLLKPFIRGDNVKRWRVEAEDSFVIFIPKGKIDIEAYPAVRDWLLPFKPDLEKRATKQQWFELQQAQLAYQRKFEAQKIVYVDIANSTPFAFDPGGTYIDCTLFMISGGDASLLAFLNSKVAWFQWIGETPIASGGYIRLKQQYIAPTALPDATTVDRNRLSALANSCVAAAKRRFEVQTAVRRRLLDLVPAGCPPKLTRKLEDWWELDFNAFAAEVKRAFRADIPVKERGQWESYLAENAAEVRTLSASIEAGEREIDEIVYRLFDLTQEEIKLLEDSLRRQG
jgi:hypothetical protein